MILLFSKYHTRLNPSRNTGGDPTFLVSAPRAIREESSVGRQRIEISLFSLSLLLLLQSSGAIQATMSLLRAIPLVSLRLRPARALVPGVLRLNLRPPRENGGVLPVPVAANCCCCSSSSFSTSSGALTAAGSQAPVVATEDGGLVWVSRTGLCGELSSDDVGRRVRICGWVALHRVHGGLTFLNLRDHSGIVQVEVQALRSRFVRLLVIMLPRCSCARRRCYSLLIEKIGF